ncbi:STY0301 family protein [Massilia endophytica]|uniref:STY0301 family protein n=1 Tax=Massilia endophytica TaxID=2899220 RepID=UPI001E411CA6|nr:STY0301 family protein [Massilia endophytica]UGQ48714.1 hypothetical protein LSQ66_09710 [Massilia endophytica]
MKRGLLGVLVLFPIAAAAQEYECPQVYPEQATKLAGLPPNHAGSGLARSGRLSNAYIHIGALHSDPNGFDAMQIVPRRIRGGWETEDRFKPHESKWLVCEYGGERSSAHELRHRGLVEWWEQIAPTATYCVLRFTELKHESAVPSSWTAKASCM